jgi:hypothetical protein
VYLDPSILRLAEQPARGERVTITVPDLRWRTGFEPGERFEVCLDGSSRWATVVSWDPERHVLVADYDRAP